MLEVWMVKGYLEPEGFGNFSIVDPGDKDDWTACTRDEELNTVGFFTVGNGTRLQHGENAEAWLQMIRAQHEKWYEEAR